MTKNSLKNGPDEFGYYGEFGSRYAPEILMPNLIELEKAFNDAINDKNNALIIAGLTLANKLISNPHEMSNDTQIDLSSIIKKIDLALEK